MSENINNLSLLNILPENLRDDTICKCFSKAFDSIMVDALNKVKYIQFFSRVNSLSDIELNLLSKELHVDVYDENWSISQKRNACKNSIEWHIYNGTPWILDHFVKEIYGQAELEEWFDYKGYPYHFRLKIIELFNSGNDADTLNKIYEAIVKYKNQRSQIDGINVFSTAFNEQRFIGLTKSECIFFVLSDEQL